MIIIEYLMDQLTFFGSIGAFLILFAFGMNQLHRWKDTYLIYDLFNFIGGTIMVAYALILHSYPFAFLNTVWALLSLRDIFFDLKKSASSKKRSFYRKWLK